MKILKRELNPQLTKLNYKKVVWFYDLWSGLTESKAAKLVLDLADIKDNQHVLEVGCGTGLVFKKMVMKNPHGKNTGMDLSPDMLAKARQRMLKTGYTNYELMEGDVLNLDFPDNSFDVLINNFMIDLMPEETFDKIAGKFFRLLKTDGIIVISTFGMGSKFWSWLAKSMPDLLTGCRPVSFGRNLLNAGFQVEEDIRISQNTFPANILKARK